MRKYTYITGGAGMIGSALVARLVSQGHDVLVLDNFSRGRAEFVNPHAKVVGCDLAYGIPQEVLDAYPPGAIYHLACRIGGVNYMLSHQLVSHRNACIDWNVFEVALQYNIPLLYCSTACIYPTTIQTRERYQAEGSLSLAEDDATSNGARPESVYGWAKLIGELALTAHVEQFPEAPFKIVRMFNVYGPREVPSQATGHVIPALIHKVLTGAPPIEVWGDGSAMRSFLYCDDAADGMITVMEKGRNGVPYNLGAPEVVSVRDLALMIVDAITNGSISVKDAVRFDTSKPTGVFGRAPVTDRVEQELGWSPRWALEQGIKETVRWSKDWLMRHENWNGELNEKWVGEKAQVLL